MNTQAQPTPDHLTTTQPVDQTALNNLRVQTIVDSLQEQRNQLSNEVVSLKADVAIANGKLVLEIQTSRQQQVTMALDAAKIKELQEQLSTLELAYKLQTELFDNATAQLSQLQVTSGLSTSEIPALHADSLVALEELIKAKPETNSPA